jgi:hypothetical protein
MVDVSRRRFIKTSVMSTCLFAASVLDFKAIARADEIPSATLGLREYLLICDSNAPPEAFTYTVPRVTPPGFIVALDRVSTQTFKINTPFFGRTIDQNPWNKNEMVTLEKGGRRGAVIDFERREVVKLFKPASTNVFTGYAAYVSDQNTYRGDGRCLITLEDNEHQSFGQLIIRDPASLRMLASLYTYGVGAQQCRLWGKNTILVLNGAGTSNASPNLAWIELSSGKLLNQIRVGIENGLHLYDMDVSSHGWIGVGGKNVLPNMNFGRIAIVSPGGETTLLRAPSEIEAQMIDAVAGIAFLDASNYIAATMPYANLLLIWNVKTHDFVQAVNLSKPGALLANGLSREDSGISMLVASNSDKNLIEAVLSSADNRLAARIVSYIFGGRGSHLVRVYV